MVVVVMMVDVLVVLVVAKLDVGDVITTGM